MRLLPALALLAVAVLAGLSTAPVSARGQVGGIGGRGDASAVAQCPAGQELRGFRARTGAWFDQIQILCAGRNGSGRYNDPPVPPPGPDGRKFGGTGGADQEHYCPSDYRLDQFYVWDTEDQRRVQYVKIYCEREGKSFGYEIGKPDPTARGGWGAHCQHYEVLVGITVNYGKDVNALGYVCDTQPPIQAEPRRTAPPPPEKPVKHTGKGVTLPPPPPGPPSAPVAPRQAIAGLWQLRTDAGAHYQITIQPITQGIGPNGMELPLQVAGTIVNDDGNHQLDGGLQGVVQPNSRILVFNYALKNGDGGGGTFTLSSDGRSLTGEATNKAKQHFVWIGTRAP